MELSLFLAKILGLSLITFCLGIFRNIKLLPKIARSVSQNLALVIFSGFILIILGLLIVISHNVWSNDWRILITLLGYLTLLKGVIRIFLPGVVMGIARVVTGGMWWTALTGLFFLLGVYLTAIGFGSGLLLTLE